MNVHAAEGGSKRLFLNRLERWGKRNKAKYGMMGKNKSLDAHTVGKLILILTLLYFHT